METMDLEGAHGILKADPYSVGLDHFLAEFDARATEMKNPLASQGVRGNALGRRTGIEPVTPGITIQCSTD